MSVRSPVGVHDSSLLANSPTCPGLFYTIAAQDGQLVRIRIPGGLLNGSQCRVLAEVAEQLGNGTIDITNRANIQIRGLRSAVPATILSQLQTAKLAAPLGEVDHLRNIMASPTAGIDPAQLLDTRPAVWALDAYLGSDAALAGLSPKFSIGLDGGEQVSIAQQPNDIRLTAIEYPGDLELAAGVYFRLSLAKADASPNPQILLKPEACVAVIAALANLYLARVRQMPEVQLSVRKPRLKQILTSVDLTSYLVGSVEGVAVVHRPVDSPCGAVCVPLGIHPQRDGRSFLGLALPLGRLQTSQLRQLADLAERYGNGWLRLTPWRNLLLADLPNHHLAAVQQAIDRLDLSAAATSAWEGMVACSGSTGCAASATDTQSDALTLAASLEQLPLDQPITIHFSGCSKSCAHHGSSDLTLVGVQSETAIASYQLYVGELDAAGKATQPFGRQLAADLLPSELSQRVTQLLSLYQQRRSHSRQTFREFANQHFTQLQHWFDSEK
ncbi:precorrin-3B synthase [Phormidium tenue FACHB-886]|nr:precorrin-3B synthase [Phormidium tenue FACHB-886]